MIVAEAPDALTLAPVSIAKITCVAPPPTAVAPPPESTASCRYNISNERNHGGFVDMIQRTVPLLLITAYVPELMVLVVVAAGGKTVVT